MKQNPQSFSKVYVAEGFFEQRYDIEGNLRGFIGGFNEVENFMVEAKRLGINFITINQSEEISPNLYLTETVE